MDPLEPEASHPSVFSSGYLIFRHSDRPQFLLMRHGDRWDLPKGHLDDGETKKQAALRELEEETGLTSSSIWTDPEFVFEHRYWVTPRGGATKRALKELTIYLGFLLQDRAIECTEHLGHQGWNWAPPHRIQVQTIDPLLESVDRHLQRSATARSMLKLG
ncbi:MAG: NUDIX domain-containing protein [Planctomycetota bacterium]